MSKFFLWVMLSQLLGSPLGAIAVLVVGAWVLDRVTVQSLPDPFRGVLRMGRVRRLEQTIAQNPHDRRARFELAELLSLQRRWSAAYAVLAPNLPQDDDAATLLVLGTAAHRSGRVEEAERLLRAAHAADPNVRLGAVELELAALLLATRRATEAEALLRAHLTKRRSSIQARVRLAEAREAQGDAAGGKALRREAWAEYRTLPSYVRRDERTWAWRAERWRVAAVVVGAAASLAIGLSALGSLDLSAPGAPPVELDD